MAQAAVALPRHAPDKSAIASQPHSTNLVDTGPWIFGKQVMLLVGTVVRVDVKEEKVSAMRPSLPHQRPHQGRLPAGPGHSQHTCPRTTRLPLPNGCGTSQSSFMSRLLPRRSSSHAPANDGREAPVCGSDPSEARHGSRCAGVRCMTRAGTLGSVR